MLNMLPQEYGFRNHGPLFTFIFLFLISSIIYIISLVLFSFDFSLYFFYVILFSISVNFILILISLRSTLGKNDFISFYEYIIKAYLFVIFTPILVKVLDNYLTRVKSVYMGITIVFLASGLIFLFILRRGNYEVFDSKSILILFLPFWFLIISIFTFFQPLLFTNEKIIIDFTNFNVFYKSVWLLLLLFEIIISSMILSFIDNKHYFYSLIKSIKPFRSLHFVGMVLIGLLMFSSLSNNRLVFDDYLLVSFPVIVMVSIWQYTTMINDFYDIKIDEIVHPDRPLVERKIDPKLYREIAIIFGIFSILLSFIFSLEITIIVILCVIMGTIYSVPPVRLKNKIYGHISVGFGSSSSFIVGVYGFYSMKNDLNLIYYSEGIKYLFPKIFFLTLIIFAVFSISPLINAIKDYEGDKMANVNNIYTVYGLKKGKKIVTILIILLFMVPLTLFNSLIDVIILIILSLSSSFVFYKYEGYKLVFLLYFIEIGYLLYKLVILL